MKYGYYYYDRDRLRDRDLAGSLGRRSTSPSSRNQLPYDPRAVGSYIDERRTSGHSNGSDRRVSGARDERIGYPRDLPSYKDVGPGHRTDNRDDRERRHSRGELERANGFEYKRGDPRDERHYA